MVDRDLFERYEKALGTNADMFSRAIADLAAEVDGMDGAALREHLASRYPQIVRAYGSVAAQAALEFYESQRALAGGTSKLGEYEAVERMPDWLDGESEAQVNAVSAGVSSAVAEVVRDFLDGRGMRSVMGCADSTLDFNTSRDPAHPKWALVPRATACPWCVMLGSRGFVYQSELTVGASRHNRCKCTPIVDFDTANPKLKGYDPKKLLKEYEAREKSGETSFRQRRPKKTRRYEKKTKRKTINAQNSHAQAAKLVDYLSKAENVEDFKRRALKVDAQWRVSKHEGGAYEKLRKRYVELAEKWGIDPNKRPEVKEDVSEPFKKMYAEMKRRHGDDVSGLAVLKTRDIKPHEYRAYFALIGAKYDITVRAVDPVARASGHSSPDVLLEGKIWELKCPNGSNPKKTVSRNINKAIRQMLDANPPVEDLRVILSTMETSLTDDQVLYQVDRVLENTKENLVEVMVIKKNGDIVRRQRNTEA